MNEVKRIKRIFILSWLINLNCIVQMLILPEKCFGTNALWKASSFLLFCIYYFIIYLKVIVNKNNDAKYLSNKDVFYFYLDIFVKLIIIVFSLFFVKNFRNTSNLYLGIIIQASFIILDVILELKIVAIFKSIFLKEESEREVHLIKYKAIESNETDLKNIKIILLSFVGKLIIDLSYVVGIFIFKDLNDVIMLTIFNVLAICAFLKIWKTYATQAIKENVYNKKTIRFIIADVIYSAFSFVMLQNNIKSSSQDTIVAVIIYTCVFYGIVKKCAVREYPKSEIDRYQAA